jgi:hypothetical protein
MPGFAFAMSVVPGKEEFDRKTLEEIAGPRIAEHEALARNDRRCRRSDVAPGQGAVPGHP